eukprot:SAG31_NODE_9110_length_1333_cov_0.852512_1_plen_142_part_00
MAAAAAASQLRRRPRGLRGPERSSRCCVLGAGRVAADRPQHPLAPPSQCPLAPPRDSPTSTRCAAAAAHRRPSRPRAPPARAFSCAQRRGLRAAAQADLEYEQQGDFKPPSEQEIADYAKYLGAPPAMLAVGIAERAAIVR